MNKTLSIIIPAYNEERCLLAILDKVQSVALPDGIVKEIIVVDDGSTDQTARIADDYAKTNCIKVFHKPNGGKTSAILEGIKNASGDIFLIQDADLEYDPNQYPQLLAPILDSQVEVVYGSRFLGNIDKMLLINRLANLMSNWTMRLLWGAHITDINTCYKVFTRDAFSGITITTHHFAFETEATVKFLKKGLIIKEIPIKYHARTREEGKKIRWSTALEMYWPIIKYRFFR